MFTFNLYSFSSIHTNMSIIVVGGGLAGLSAAHTLLERGANVLLLDKQGLVPYILSPPSSMRS